MNTTGFPTSSDIYLEADGKKIAVVQSYTAKTTKTSRTVEAFGSREPVGTIDGRVQHQLELTRVRVLQGIQDPVDFYQLSGFNVVIARPDRKIIYSDCQWSSIFEAASAEDLLFETVTLVAGKRMEVLP